MSGCLGDCHSVNGRVWLSEGLCLVSVYVGLKNAKVTGVSGFFGCKNDRG